MPPPVVRGSNISSSSKDRDHEPPEVTRSTFLGNLFGRRTVSPTFKRLGLPTSDTPHPPPPPSSSSHVSTPSEPPSNPSPKLLPSPAIREKEERERQLESVDSQHLVWALLEHCASEIGRWEGAPKVESLVRALTARVQKSKDFYQLFPPLSGDSSSASTDPLPSPPILTFSLSKPDDFIPALLKILCTLLLTTSPLSIRLAGFDLLSTYLSSPRSLLPPNDIPPADLGSFLKLVVDRREANLDDIEARVRCLKALVEGGGGTWDGWGDWSEVVGTLKSWQEDLQRAWELEEAREGQAFEGSSTKYAAKPIHQHLPALEKTLELLRLIIQNRTSLFSPQDLHAIVSVSAGLAWSGILLTSTLTTAVPLEDIVEVYTIKKPRRPSETSVTQQQKESSEGGLGLMEIMRENAGQVIRGRLGRFTGGGTGNSSGSGSGSVSRSRSLSKKAPPTTSTSFGSSVNTPNPSKIHAPTPLSPVTSTTSSTGTTYTSHQPHQHRAQAVAPPPSIHPLSSSFISLVQTLTRTSFCPPTIIAPSVRLLFAMLSIGGETGDRAWLLVSDLFGKGYSARFRIALRDVLAGTGEKAKLASQSWGEPEDWEVVITRGAVVCVRLALQEAYRLRRAKSQPSQNEHDHPSSSLPTSTSSSNPSSYSIEGLELGSFDEQLRSAMTVNRTSSPASSLSEDEIDLWQAVDTEVLRILEDILEGTGEEGMDAVLGDGNIMVETMDCAKIWVEKYRSPEGRPFLLRREREINQAALTHSSIVNLFSRLTRLLPRRLHGHNPDDSNFRLPRRLTALLLDLAPNLSEEACKLVVERYQTEDLCLPFHSSWIENLSKLVGAFYHASPVMGHMTPPHPARDYPDARKAIANLLFVHVYSRVKFSTENRTRLLREVILPLLESTLQSERIPEIEELGFTTLIDAAVFETWQMDKEVRNRERAEREGLSSEGVVNGSDPPAKGCFEAITRLLVKIGSSSSCFGRSRHDYSSPTLNFSHSSTPISPILSPIASAAENLPSISSLSFSKDLSASSEPHNGSRRQAAPPPSHSPARTPIPPSHTNCKSVRASQALISIFSRLTFGSTTSLLNKGRVCSLSSTRAIEIFAEMLDLLRPHESPFTTRTQSPSRKSIDQLQNPRLHASCPRGRLILVQWMLRLRADTQHRVFVRSKRPDGTAAASLFGRSKKTEKPVPDTEATDALKKVSEKEERGRNFSRGRREGSSRSRSRIPELGSSRDVIEHPLWYAEEDDAFEMPLDSTPANGMNTFDPDRVIPADQDMTLIPQGAWLFVAEYLQVLLELLTDEPDWELVSYVLVYLPLQLVNQHFFCGPRSRESIQNLLNSLCLWLGPGGGLPIARHLPTGIKKTDLSSVAYQTLDVLMSYHRQFSSAEHVSIVKAFHAGISANEATAKVCIQALTAAVHDLGSALTKNLPEILTTLSALHTNISISIHTLEFIYSVSQLPSLYNNFTNDHYETVFAVALNIITTHHDSVTSQPEHSEPLPIISAYVTSQHLLQFAYAAIYPWFLALPVRQRAAFVPFIVGKLVQAKRSPDDEDERSEVCIDFLHRYTYSNADPKPAASFMGDLVMPSPHQSGAAGAGGGVGGEDDDIVTKHWALGNAFLTIHANKRTGWGKIETKRPSGTVSMILKLENVPLIGLGNDEADLVSLSAVLVGDGNPEVVSKLVPDRDKDVAMSVTEPRSRENMAEIIRGNAPGSPSAATPSSSKMDRTSTSGIWSGASPSQRRKEVLIDPSFIAQQYFTYPEQSDFLPRLVVNPANIKSINGLDENYSVIDKHDVGVLYVGPGQTTASEIFSNVDGSQNYTRFVHGLGRVVKLAGQKDIPFLYKDGIFGEYSYAWWDDIQVICFHVATLMPNLPDYPKFDNKMEPIGNSFVRIVFNDSGRDYTFDTIKSDFLYCNIVISPHSKGSSRTHDDPDEHNFFKVTVQRRDGLPEFGPVGQFKIVSAASLPSFVRQLTLYADLISSILADVNGSKENITSWRRRLKLIHRIREKAIPVPSSTAGADLAVRLNFTRNLEPPKV